MSKTPGFISYDIKMDQAFEAGLKRAQQQVEDLRPALKSIAADFYRSEKSIFMLKSAGGYPDFKISPITTDKGTYTPKESAYKIRKKKMYGFDYPLLKATGALADSLLSPSGKGSIYQLDKQSLTIGSDIPYLKYHQSDEPRSKMPLRKALFIGPETTTPSNPQLQGRMPRWLNILNTYVLRSMGVSAADAKGPTNG
jgi:phage gpG-like protein